MLILLFSSYFTIIISFPANTTHFKSDITSSGIIFYEKTYHTGKEIAWGQN